MHDVSETRKEIARGGTPSRGPRAWMFSVKATRLAAVFCTVAALSAVAVAKESDRPMRVSLVQLIAAPEQFEGKLIQVAGYCFVGFEERALYLSKDDFANNIRKNAIWLDLKGHDELSGQYVMAEGVFSGMVQSENYAGSLGKVAQFVVQKKRPAPK